MPSIPPLTAGAVFVPNVGDEQEPSAPPTPLDGYSPSATTGLELPSGVSGSGALGAMQWSPTPYSLPAKVPLGAVTIHRYEDARVLPSTIAVSVFAPMSSEGVILDLNAKKASETIPDRCVIGDAGLTRAFLGIDKRPGTPLSQRLDAIVAKIPKNAAGQIEAEAAIQYVRVQTNQLIAWTAGSGFNDGRAEFSWDKAIVPPTSVWETFKSVANDPIGAPIKGTGFEMPVVALEKYLEAGEGYCIQKALLASLILERCGVPHRLVNGAVSTGPGTSTGHTWIQLADGRVLDPAWKLVATTTTEGAPVPGFFKLGSSWRFENQTFPYLSLS